jgi:hypothetical protein
MSGRARLCAFGALLCVGLAAPGLARAADPFGGLGAEVQSALAATQAAVDEATTAAGVQLSTPIVPPQAAAGIANAVAAATAPAEAAASAPTWAAEAASGEPEHPVAVARGEARGAARHSGRPGRPHPAGLAAPRTTAPAAAAPPPRAAALRAPSVARATTRAARPHEAPAGALPQRLPPDRLPSGPDMTSSGAAAGQSPLAPLLLVALAAAFALFGLELLPRPLPVPAFRKPRHIGLPSWHPG